MLCITRVANELVRTAGWPGAQRFGEWCYQLEQAPSASDFRRTATRLLAQYGP